MWRSISRKLVMSIAIVAVLFSMTSCNSSRTSAENAQPKPIATSYLGFDLNLYPGDDALPILRKTYAFSGYWIGPPPGEKNNTWRGKRELMRSQGFGFLVLFRGRESRELKTEANAKEKSALDARAAAAAAQEEGFAKGTVIFLDVEEGGRLPPAYHSYLRDWADQITKSGYRPGVYCSAVPWDEGNGVTIRTADDIRTNIGSRDLVYWVFNDVCPPAPGCVAAKNPLPPSTSGVPYAAVWQFAQSPRRKERTGSCATTYHTDGNCYAPGDTSHQWFLDVNSASSADPSAPSK